MTIPHLTTQQLAVLSSIWQYPRDMSFVNGVIDDVNEKGKPRTTVNGESMTVEAAQKLFEQTKDSHDWRYVYDDGFTACMSAWSGPVLAGGYTYTPKQPKLKHIDWSKVPVGASISCGTQVFELRGHDANNLLLEHRNGKYLNRLSEHKILVKLAPASEQRWIVGDSSQISQLENLGLSFTWRECGRGIGDGMIVFKIKGLASGYTDGGEV